MTPLHPDKIYDCRTCQYRGLAKYIPQKDRLRAECAACGAWLTWAPQKGQAKSRLATMQKWFTEMAAAERYAFLDWVDGLETSELEDLV